MMNAMLTKASVQFLPLHFPCRSRTTIRTPRCNPISRIRPQKDVWASGVSDAVVDETSSENEIKQEPLVLSTSDESETLLRIRHSCAHVMAMAVKRLFPEAQCTIGPWTDFGFYYDFDFAGHILTDKDLKRISKEMRKIITEDLPFLREEVTETEALRRIHEIKEPYKEEILGDILKRDPEAKITIYHVGEKDHPSHWWDLCAGPHVPKTSDIQKDAFRLESVAGAYWRGDERNQQLTRIYGTAWRNKNELDAYQALKIEAASRDHRRLGTELKLFSIREEAGPGLVFWLPAGARIRHIIESYWKDIHLKNGYELVYTPHVAKVDLWKTSGHFDFYGENMFDQMDIENVSYQLRPMNCPFHILQFKEGYYSYKALPVRFAELGTVYRYERSGTMHGLSRVRGFTQDDAHIFCLPQQITEEITNVLRLVEEIMSRFGFEEYEMNLSTRPEKFVGSDSIWEMSEASLKTALEQKGYPYTVDVGGGAFYGPKIDVKVRDAIGRKWQCSTIQLDFNLPERFDITYNDEHGEKQRPIVIHRAIFGSLERFFGILIENCKGAFDFWLAPVQCKILPVHEGLLPYCKDVAQKMRNVGLRVEITSGERMGKLIRNAETSKTPVMCVVGEKERDSKELSIRTYAYGDAGSFPVDDVIDLLSKAAANPDEKSLFKSAFGTSTETNGC